MRTARSTLQWEVGLITILHLIFIFIIKLIKDEKGINGTLHTLIDKKCFLSNSRYNQVEENCMKKQLKEEYILKLYAKWTEAQSGRSTLTSYPNGTLNMDIA